ncbi:uncharacterized protein with NRDE domain [Geothermobacter ehrlichii]|uniref:Uncharacterized protein with NRDE domain n=1 Tax=Geothermobacter ehrlichii TaxID=213224 RepID=A0A5D3WHA5_9BACT|nr:NRDE family protein [Geothermobacter ehrlichii]TYO98143.1 uncharacterized protein with NRDE domain [Geothermobacter ehrlichii]
MCLILFAIRPDDRYRLVLAANRDEFYERPSAPAAFWPDAPDIWGGRDLQAGGTWFGVTRSGRLALVSNVREPKRLPEPGPSRGLLVRDFLRSETDAAGWLTDVLADSGRRSGFNLIVGEGDHLFYGSNRRQGVVPVRDGLYGLSNAGLDTPWPKVRRGKKGLAGLLRRRLAGEELAAGLFALLGDRTPAADDELPDTGVGLAMERALSPVFICAGQYGTRSSTVLLLEATGRLLVVERRFGPDGRITGESRESFRIS